MEPWAWERYNGVLLAHMHGRKAIRVVQPMSTMPWEVAITHDMSYTYLKWKELVMLAFNASYVGLGLRKKLGTHKLHCSKDADEEGG